MLVYLLLVAGLVLLAWGGDVMVKGAVVLAKNMGVSALLIGLTLIGFGTSTPELLTSLLAVFQKSDGIAVGNVVGSNIANILLVLGVAALIRPINVDVKAFKRDSSFLVISSLILCAAVAFGYVNFLAGLLMTLGLITYVVYSYLSDKKNQKKLREMEKETEKDLEEIAGKLKGYTVPFLLVVVGLLMMLGGARLLVDNSIILARSWGVSEAIIGLTIVAVGTSLPELATSIVAAVRRQGDVAFGNVVGSNIYNSLFILGVTALFMPVTVPSNMTRDIVIMMIVTLILVAIAFIFKKLSRLIGMLFLITYAVYIYMMFA